MTSEAVVLRLAKALVMFNDTESDGSKFAAVVYAKTQIKSICMFNDIEHMLLKVPDWLMPRDLVIRHASMEIRNAHMVCQFKTSSDQLRGLNPDVIFYDDCDDRTVELEMLALASYGTSLIAFD